MTDSAPQPCFRRQTDPHTCAQHGGPWTVNGCAANPYADGGPAGTGDWPEVQTHGAPASAQSDIRTLAEKLKAEVHYLHPDAQHGGEDYAGPAAACDVAAGLQQADRPMTFAVSDATEVTCTACTTYLEGGPPLQPPGRCYLCGDAHNHGGYPHGEVTGDYRVRADVNPCTGADFGCSLGEGHDGPHERPACGCYATPTAGFDRRCEQHGDGE